LNAGRPERRDPTTITLFLSRIRYGWCSVSHRRAVWGALDFPLEAKTCPQKALYGEELTKIIHKAAVHLDTTGRDEAILVSYPTGSGDDTGAFLGFSSGYRLLQLGLRLAFERFEPPRSLGWRGRTRVRTMEFPFFIALFPTCQCETGCVNHA
jgi:hypothetical protein